MRSSSSLDSNTYIFPGEKLDDVSNFVQYRSGGVFFDINGNAKPNTWGKDQFYIPLSKEGILYDSSDSASSGS